MSSCWSVFLEHDRKKGSEVVSEIVKGVCACVWVWVFVRVFSWGPGVLTPTSHGNSVTQNCAFRKWNVYLALVSDIVLQNVTSFLSGHSRPSLRERSWSNKVQFCPFTSDGCTRSAAFPYPTLYDCKALEDKHRPEQREYCLSAWDGGLPSEPTVYFWREHRGGCVRLTLYACTCSHPQKHTQSHTHTQCSLVCGVRDVNTYFS